MNEDIPQNPPESPGPPPEPVRAAAPPPPPAQQPSRPGRYILPLSLAIGCLPWIILFSLAIAALIGAAMKQPYGDHIALVRVSGAITGGRSGTGGVFGDSHTGAEDIIAQLERARKCKSAKAIVIRINSPGGSAAGSEEVYNEIMRIRKAGKPVYTSMADIAASGGYFIASACDRIYANATTITGSIGVIFSGGEMSELYKKIGYRPETIKSGKFKDTGSPARPMTAEERKMLQAMIDNMYDVFLSDVAKGRKLPKAEVRRIADGRVLTGNQALKAKLIDKIGGLRDTEHAAAHAAKLKPGWRVTEYGRRLGILDTLLGDGLDDASSRSENMLNRRIMEGILRQSSEAGGIR